MSDTLLRTLDLVEPGDLVLYHGSKPECHGLYMARLCFCAHCGHADHVGSADTRYHLTDPFAEDTDACVVHHVRRASITRSAVNA
ncbi:hypothetical protein AMK27_38850 [Streptomyces sp. CB02009]|uniref:hypothetical protein n=1 Tax=Streptomyces sp. CB02009 TaxID=1703938 RepID=UPI00093F52B0|nr:hypothetical protein [Streptomyces sp. CB02009]OKJ48099.1 hypothetical protein AMK27_38850 [Streptomyces sp. CB02009]